MLISKTHRFIFVKIPRTAGTSVQYGLRSLCKNQGVVNYGRLGKSGEYHDEDSRSAHSSIQRIRDMYFQESHERMEKYFKFAFVRNPWSRMLSAFWGRRNQESILSDLPEPWRVKDVKPIFKDWVLTARHHRNVDYIDIDGECALDFIGRFESLQEGYDHVCRKIGVDCHEVPERHMDKKKLHVHYSRLYDKETRNFVAEFCAEDIERFGYEFEEE